MKSDELKPCPFCGSENIDLASYAKKNDMWFVQCDGCFATFPMFDTKTEAMQSWNRRAK